MSAAAPAPAGRIGQLRAAYRNAKVSDPKIGLVVAGVFVASLVVAGAIASFLLPGNWFGWIIRVLFTVMTATLVTLIVFSRRVEKAMYAQAEGQLGAAGGALQLLRGNQWATKPAVAATKTQEVVHRVVGRPGVILVGEGNSHGRVLNLLNSEAKKHQRIVGEGVPVTTISVGRADGDVPLPSLVKTIKKLPKAVKPAQQTDLLYKLKALDAVRPTLPMPKGPVPTSMKGARRQMRG